MLKRLGILLLAGTMLVGCGTAGSKQNKGTAYGAAGGAAAGAIIGQAIGKNTDSTLIGAAIGAAVGGAVGNQVGAYMDRQEAALQNAMAASVAANQASINRVSQDMLALNFKSEVFFDHGETALKPGAYPELDRVAQVLRQYPYTNIIVEGHTDASGKAAYNQMLSGWRAEAVKMRLMQQGVAAERITTMAFGESQPISSDPAQNRRVVIKVKGQQT